MPPSAQILIVDDIADNRTVLARPLKRRGFDIVEAENGRSALELLSSRQFDLALLDINMPEMDGLDVLRRIRACESSHLPVIMVTARTQTDDAMVAFSLGANDYVTKPVNLPLLLARVEAQLARRRAEQSLCEALAKVATLNFEMRAECARRAEAEARALDIAHHDPLTGLYNRLRFRAILAERIADSSKAACPLALLSLDLDGFKQVNDGFGHAAGDELLRAVGDRLRGCVRDTDSVGRLGGDEFSVLMPTASAKEAERLAKLIVEVIARPFVIDNVEVDVGCSIGISVACGSDIDPDSLCRNSDEALYRAKNGGRGTWRFHSQPI